VGKYSKILDIIIARIIIIKRRRLLLLKRKTTKEKIEEHTVLRFALFLPPFFDDFFTKSRVRLRDIIIRTLSVRGQKK